MADLARDADLLAMAREDAFELLARDPEMSGPETRAVLATLSTRFRDATSLIDVG